MPTRPGPQALATVLEFSHFDFFRPNGGLERSSLPPPVPAPPHAEPNGPPPAAHGCGTPQTSRCRRHRPRTPQPPTTPTPLRSTQSTNSQPLPLIQFLFNSAAEPSHRPHPSLYRRYCYKTLASYNEPKIKQCCPFGYIFPALRLPRPQPAQTPRTLARAKCRILETWPNTA
jgi:hypothetical protein